MKQLVLNLTDGQFTRIETIGRLIDAKPEHVAVGVTFQSLDSLRKGGDWKEWEDVLCHSVEFYAEAQNASEEPAGNRLEDTATGRRLRHVEQQTEGAASDLIALQLTKEQLRLICGELASSLEIAMSGTSGSGNDDPVSALRDWRKHSPRGASDETADLLEKLLAQLPAEVAHV